LCVRVRPFSRENSWIYIIVRFVIGWTGRSAQFGPKYWKEESDLEVNDHIVMVILPLLYLLYIYFNYEKLVCLLIWYFSRRLSHLGQYVGWLVRGLTCAGARELWELSVLLSMTPIPFFFERIFFGLPGS